MRIRDMFTPDPGKVLLDADLSGADAQVVAWEADDPGLKDAFQRGVNIHNYNACRLFGEDRVGWDLKNTNPVLYKNVKIGVHATNYGAHAKAVAAHCKWPMHKAEQFQQQWFRQVPGILAWHDRTRSQLALNRTIANRFGFRIVYFDRDPIKEALAWLPQSTVAIVCDRGARSVKRNIPWAEVLLQVHDSVVMQIPSHKWESRHQILSALTNPVPYPDPLVIPWSLKVSSQSWGQVKDAKWTS